MAQETIISSLRVVINTPIAKEVAWNEEAMPPRMGTRCKH